ncbi:MAG: glycerol-3-phosphate cytidylyltransferase [Ignavibacteria bacterium GWA2_35_9]|nr:MAG: glycerol-3-phosphate cytidylyltransferase [Ignavibacteria bacterium GWA2_35_9]OGU43987.1 MAG: glycerol-3-phosphate cytidylyltransferase [Ignavibacteria bacterium GWB2_36_8]OGU50082.1 MAG: glycerol-3-phosphate cytidylyltransferase [Ignavibacteria bacterium GWC2_36_12]OGV02786.1 MAG: glycerol-3-phosphate cytidylyltransferase [Ignavibacteria bacterium RIFOXYB2_FULL_36_7]
MNNILSKASMKFLREKFKEEKKKVVFTNGVFDIIHSGHIDYLVKAKALGDILIVGLNSDSSVRRIKGEKRPIVSQTDRAFVLSNLKPVDYVVLFEEDTPLEIIKALVPDVLVKGADWSLDKIIGSDVVLNKGGEVKNISFVNDQSTSGIIDLILSRYSD